jgi:hypothetical protein
MTASDNGRLFFMGEVEPVFFGWIDQSGGGTSFEVVSGPALAKYRENVARQTARRALTIDQAASRFAEAERVHGEAQKLVGVALENLTRCQKVSAAAERALKQARHDLHAASERRASILTQDNTEGLQP